MRCEVYWPHMASTVCKTVTNCRKCTCTWAKKAQMPHMKMFSASSPLEFFAVDLDCLLPKTTSGNQFLVIMTNRYSELTRVMPTSNTCAMHITSIFYDHWIVLYEIYAYLSTENGTKLMTKFFEAICNFSGMKQLATVAYKPGPVGKKNDIVGRG